MAQPWPRICVFGAGAVGCFFGARLAQAGAPVTLIARDPHASAINDHGLIFESGAIQTTIRLAVRTDPQAVSDADIVLFCVKSRDTEAGARTIAPLLRPGAVVVSLQNGVDNVSRMRAAAGLDALAAVVYVACSMAGAGHVRHAGRGDLVLGEVLGDAASDVLGNAASGVLGNAASGVSTMAAGKMTGSRPASTPVRCAPDAVQMVAQCFERAGVPCPIAQDVRVDLWVKLIMNCVLNPMSALGRSHYARLVSNPAVNAVMRDVISECVAVARADGVAVPDIDTLHQAVLTLGTAMAQATSSTAQDLAAGRPTEIDSLNGYVTRRGDHLGIAVPVNRALQALVKLAEPH